MKNKRKSSGIQYLILIEPTVHINKIIQSIFKLTLNEVNYVLSNPTVEIH